MTIWAQTHKIFFSIYGRYQSGIWKTLNWFYVTNLCMLAIAASLARALWEYRPCPCSNQGIGRRPVMFVVHNLGQSLVFHPSSINTTSTTHPSMSLEGRAASGALRKNFLCSQANTPVEGPMPNSIGEGRNGTEGEIRTLTVLLLRQAPPTNWATSAYLIWTRRLDSNQRTKGCSQRHSRSATSR